MSRAGMLRDLADVPEYAGLRVTIVSREPMGDCLFVEGQTMRHRADVSFCRPSVEAFAGRAPHVIVLDGEQPPEVEREAYRRVKGGIVMRAVLALVRA